MKYEVTVKERITRTAIVEIEADNWEQAEAIARQQYQDGQLSFDEYFSGHADFETEEV